MAMTGYGQQTENEQIPLENLEKRTSSLEDAVKILQKIKISGYIQGQLQVGEKDAKLKVGSDNEDKEHSFNRIGIRRGRIKLTYEEKIISGVFQLDITEKGVGVKDAYLSIKDPWIGTSSLRAGVFDRPFGYEINYSSSRRESPERSTIFQTLFPDERDLGAMLVLQPSKTSPWNILKLEAGLFAGNGIKIETDNRKDFIGHVSVNKNIGSDAKIGVGVSYYNGGVYQSTENVYTMNDDVFTVDSNSGNKGKFAKREYVGFDAQFSIMSILGMTSVRGEYLFGQQPGSSSSAKSPNYSNLPGSGGSAPTAYDMFIRKMKGGYVMLVQDLGTFPVSIIARYDWYDPNTKISGNDVGKAASGTSIATTKTDLWQSTIGFGGLWRINPSLRLTAYYEINSWEDSGNITDYDSWEGNVFTLHLQYKF
jgi:hypothetical protein